jgi:alpha-methylacyl-CoA racemase
VPPLNLVGDFAAGSLMLAFGMVAAMWEAARSGRGQVVDAAMSDGAALLMAPFYSMVGNGSWTDRRECNEVDGGSPHYGSYRCSDGGFVSIAPIEPQFYERFLSLMQIDDPEFRLRADRAVWPSLREKLRARFLTRTRAEWCELLEGTDVCFAPVLGIAEAASHPHHVARQTFVPVGRTTQPASAPRYDRTPAANPQPRLAGREAAEVILADCGFSAAEIDRLRRSGAWLDA